MTIPEQEIGAAQFIEAMAGRESMSGPGSTLAATVEIREWLPEMFKAHSVKSMADCPCGDWTWMGAVDLSRIDYAGYDLSPSLIATNKRKYPAHHFESRNLLTHPPAKSDLIICRDFLVHLTFDHAASVLENFRESGARLLAVTTFPGAENLELSPQSTGWGWRPLDMEAAPFCLGNPLDGVNEKFFPAFPNRWTRIYRLK